MLFLWHRFQYFLVTCGHHHTQTECDDVGYRLRQLYAQDAEQLREDGDQGDKEYTLSRQRDHRTSAALARTLEQHARQDVHGLNRHQRTLEPKGERTDFYHHSVGDERPDNQSGSDETDDAEEYERHNASPDTETESFPQPSDLLRTPAETGDRLEALAESDQSRIEELHRPGNYGHGGDRGIAERSGENVHADARDAPQRLSQERRHADLQDVPIQGPLKLDVPDTQVKITAVGQELRQQDTEADQLAQNRRQRSASDTHPQHKNENRVEYYVHDRPGHHTDHTEYGFSLRTEVVVHGKASRHIWCADQNQTGIVHCIGQYRLGGAKKTHEGA